MKAFVIAMQLLLVSAFLVGCSSSGEFSDLTAQMEEIKKRPKGHIEPPPEFKAYKTFTYSAAALRSPFSPPIAVEMVQLPQGRKNVKPDMNRPKEALEGFSIDALSMVGTLRRPEGALFALIMDTNGGLHRVKPGNYMGRNHGHVQDVSVNKLNVIEIVSDGQDGWVERPRTIVLKGQN